MSSIDLSLDQDGSGEKYDRELRRTRAIHTSCRIITKANGTVEGRAIVMLVAGDTHIVLTARNFMDAAYAILGAHPGSTERSFPGTESGAMLSGVHRGVGWQAVHMEHIYVVTVEGSPGVSLAGDEATAKGLAEATIDRTLTGAA